MTAVKRGVVDQEAHARVAWMDDPLQHAFVMLGTDPLLLSHLTMFYMAEHRFQAILAIRLDEGYMAAFVADRKAHPDATYFLGNTARDEIRLTELKTGRRRDFKADVFRGIPEQAQYSHWPWHGVTPLLADIKVDLASIVYFRQFDFDVPPPEDLTYILFGSERAAYLTHHQTAWPDFDHVITLAEPPSWIAAEEIEAAVPITFRGMKTRPRGALHCKNPLPEETYTAHYDGAGELPAGGTSGAIAVRRTDWFSTKIVNIPKDPCYTGGPTPAPHHMRQAATSVGKGSRVG